MNRIFCLIVSIILAGNLAVYGQETAPADTTLRPLLQQLAEQSSAADTQVLREFVDTLTRRLLNDFDTRLACPECYRDTALKECAVFPEGDIYSFAVPAFAYANLAVTRPEMKAQAQAQIVKLVDLAIPLVIKNVEPPNNDLLRLTTYQNEATYLGTLYLMLTHYALIGGDERYDALHTHLAEIFYQAIQNSHGESLHSYPEYTWHFDTLFVLLALYLDDLRSGEHRADTLIAQHLQWKTQHATHQATGLPEAYEGALPRGCDLSMQIGILSQIAPYTARTVYQRYVASHWINYGFLAGFAEWPVGHRDTRALSGDFDSGPIIFNIGLTATGVGLLTTQAMHDQNRFQVLSAELQMVSPMIQTLANMDSDSELLRWFKLFAPLDASYFTGFLYGDAMMFYALTWVPYAEYQRSR
jgi:hypothetical protein